MKCELPRMILILDVYSGYSELEVFVNGTGPVSNTVRSMVDGLNYTYFSNQTISNTGMWHHFHNTVCSISLALKVVNSNGVGN